LKNLKTGEQIAVNIEQLADEVSKQLAWAFL
jgi:hypothetical protein